MKNFVRYQVPLIMWAMIIFWLSSIQNIPIVRTPIIAADKLAHMTIYFVFCWFGRRAFFFQDPFPFLRRWSLAAACFLTVAYGYFDEVHQRFVPGRTYDYTDMLADAIGALLFVASYALARFWKSRRGG